MKPAISVEAKGKWRAILEAVGISRDFLTGRHGPCPLCGGKDRFRLDDRDGRGTFYCSQCGAGDGVELVKRFLGLDFKQAVREIEKHVGSAKVVPIRQGRSETEVRAEMNTIWRQAKPLGAIEACSRYWGSRTGQTPVSGDLRGLQSLRCPGAGDHPAMVALVRDATGKAVNLHRTYLSPDGDKADIPEPRRVMDISLPRGSAVRLAPPSEILGVAEGIETAEACRLLFGVPVWAALNAQNLTAFEPPEGVTQLMIFGDNDTNLTGHWAAYTLGRKLRCSPRFKDNPKAIEIHITNIEGEDWNDVWRDTLRHRQEINAEQPRERELHQ